MSVYESGELEKFPHKGYVKIGDNVEIYDYSSVARGSLSDTVIGNGTRLDSLVYIARNVFVGRIASSLPALLLGTASLLAT